jgi:thiosulfate dehydrogenase
MKKAVVIVGIIIAVLLVFRFSSGGWYMPYPFAPGHGRFSLDADPIARGGRGYDNFWVEYQLEVPQGMHASYPQGGKAGPSDSWRCKECHGWDYLGNQGAYRAGSHFTGIGGIASAQGKSVESITEILSNEIHRYDQLLSPAALKQIAGFVAEGQIDMRQIIDYKSRGVASDPAQGKLVYNDICADCHGKDGREFNFAHDGEPAEYIGTLASDNPWEALHKIRNGHPGAFVNHMTGEHTSRRGMGTSFMPPTRTQLSVGEQGSLLAYLQSLPGK